MDHLHAGSEHKIFDIVFLKTTVDLLVSTNRTFESTFRYLGKSWLYITSFVLYWYFGRELKFSTGRSGDGPDHHLRGFVHGDAF